MNFSIKALLPQIETWLIEDDLLRNYHYSKTLPKTPVKLSLKIKSPMILSGLDYLTATFVALGIDDKPFEFLNEFEGKKFSGTEAIDFPFEIPFSAAVTGERLALNLVQHASSISTWTAEHVALAQESGIKILDTRKTTPGMRAIEKYAVRVGGGFNHRLGQTDTWMIKDNHKTCLGGIKGAWDFFQSQGSFYNNTVVEIHDLKELKTAIELGITQVMLDNFSAADVKTAVGMKKPGMTFEVSGGLRLHTIKDYLISGVDALSIGSLTYSAPKVDVSLKYKPL
jgi:nicotinate-nucleotide pyrophosphorylase (carboxylating)